MKQPNIKQWTKGEVELLLNEFNDILLNNIFLIKYLKKEFLAKSVYCLSMLPEEEDIYEVLVNGSVLVNLEFNKHTNDVLVCSIIDEYIKILNNESGRNFLDLLKKLVERI